MLNIKLFTFNPVRENTYVLYNEQGWCALVDPGCYFDFEKRDLIDFLHRSKLQPKYLLNTHCHLDHVFGNQVIADTYELPLHLHPLEEPLLEAAPLSGAQWGLPFEPFRGTLAYLREGDRIVLGEDLLEVFEAPGHSPGSLLFYCRAQGLVIGGDVLFRESIGRTDLPGGDHATLLSSIRDKLFSLPDEVLVYPGHGEATRIGHEKNHNPFLHQANR